MNQQDARPLAFQLIEDRFNNDTAWRHVMVKRFKDDRSNRHVRLYKDQKGLYIRPGKLHQRKTYIRELPHADIIDRAHAVVILYEQY